MKLKLLFLSLFISGTFALPAVAESFSVKEKENKLPSQQEFYEGCLKENNYTYLPNAGEPQSSVDKKRAKIKAAAVKKCKCVAPLEYALAKDTIGDDPEAFAARMQADQSLAMETAKFIVDKKRRIDKQCSK